MIHNPACHHTPSLTVMPFGTRPGITWVAWLHHCPNLYQLSYYLLPTG